MIYLSQGNPLYFNMRAQTNMAVEWSAEYLQAHNTVNQIVTALDNVTDPLEINGLVLRLDYIIRTLVNLVNHPQTDEIIRMLGEACNELTSTSEAGSRLNDGEVFEFASQVYTQRRGRSCCLFSCLFSSRRDLKSPQLHFYLGCPHAQ